MIKLTLQSSNLVFQALNGPTIYLTVPAGAIANSALYTVRVTVDPTLPTSNAKLEIIGPGITGVVGLGNGTLAGASGIVQVYIG